MTAPARPKSIRRAFIRGFLTVLPTLITILILWKAGEFLYRLLAAPIGNQVKTLMEATGLLPKQFPVDNYLVRLWKAAPHVVGISAAILIVYFVGFLVASVIGRRIVRALEQAWISIPIVKQVYPYVKQFTDALLTRSESGRKFIRVVAIEYPRPGIYSLGFVVSEGMKDIVDAAGKPLLGIFVPSSPTPFTGYVVSLPSKDVIPLNMSVDQAVRFVVSLGVIVPPQQLASHRVDRPKEALKADEQPV